MKTKAIFEQLKVADTFTTKDVAALIASDSPCGYIATKFGNVVLVSSNTEAINYVLDKMKLPKFYVDQSFAGTNPATKRDPLAQ